MYANVMTMCFVCLDIVMMAVKPTMFQDWNIVNHTKVQYAEMEKVLEYDTQEKEILLKLKYLKIDKRLRE